MMMQRAIMCLEQGATGLAGLEALLPRRNAAQTHNYLCPRDLCGKAAWHLPPWRYKHQSSANLR